jgi:hypothetical protein
MASAASAADAKRVYVASHPGGINPELIRFLRYNPFPSVMYLFGFAIFALLTVAAVAVQVLFIQSPERDAELGYASSIPFAAAAAFCLIRFLQYWRSVKRHYEIGCVNPAVVVSERPLLIAVHTDLARSGDDAFSFPVIKVLRVKLGRAGDAKPRAGDTLVTVSLYGGRRDKTPYWDDFDPWPAAHAMSDPARLKAIAESLEEEEWRRLHEGVQALAVPYSVGVYPLPVVRRAPMAAPSEN